MASDAERINQYANAMFSAEALPEAWIARCADYLRFLFGDSLQGRTVIDYGFGRGNWSLAFLRVGAARVIAIDASSDNVRRFGSYCKSHSLSQVEVVEANFVEGPSSFTADLIWVYGVLQHIPEVDLFLDRLRSCADGPHSQFYFYHYNSGSPRAFLVENCRKLKVYSTQAQFESDAALFIRQARIRARDDLVAPHVAWRSSQELSALLRAKGFFPFRKDVVFEEFLTGVRPFEFLPHQWLCGLRPNALAAFEREPDVYAEELEVLEDIFCVLRPLLASSECEKVVIGLFNTYFSALAHGDAEGSFLTEVFVYLASLLRAHPEAVLQLKQRASRTLDSWKLSLEGNIKASCSELKMNKMEETMLRVRYRI